MSDVSQVIQFVTNSDREVAVMNVLIEAIGVDGAHHKQWYIDQAIRALAGSNYDYLVSCYQGYDKETGDVYYEWDEGIAP